MRRSRLIDMASSTYRSSSSLTGGPSGTSSSSSTSPASLSGNGSENTTQPAKKDPWAPREPLHALTLIQGQVFMAYQQERECRQELKARFFRLQRLLEDETKKRKVAEQDRYVAEQALKDEQTRRHGAELALEYQGQIYAAEFNKLRNATSAAAAPPPPPPPLLSLSLPTRPPPSFMTSPPAVTSASCSCCPISTRKSSYHV